MSGREIKRLRARLSGQVNLFENLLKSKDRVNIENEMNKTEEVLRELQGQVERFVDACDGDEDKDADVTQIKQMMKEEEESVKSVKRAVVDWLTALTLLDTSEKKSTKSAAASIDGSQREKEKRKESNLERTVEVMRMQFELQKQVEGFDNTAHLHDEETVLREVEHIERLYHEMANEVISLKIGLSEEENVKVCSILQNSEKEVRRIRKMGKGIAEVLTMQERRSTASSRSIRSEKRKTTSSRERGRSLSVGQEKKAARNKSMNKDGSSVKEKCSNKGNEAEFENDVIDLVYKTWEFHIMQVKDQMNLIKEILKTTNTHMMKKELEKLEQLCKEVVACEEEILKVANENETDKVVKRTRQVAEDVQTTKMLANTWLEQNERREGGSNRSRGSKKSRKSASSKVSSKSGSTALKDHEEEKVKSLKGQLTRNQVRLSEQRQLVLEMLNQDEVEDVEREIEVMEKCHESMLAATERLSRMLPLEEAKALCEQSLGEERELTSIKQKFVKWMVEQEEDDRTETTRTSRRSHITEMAKQLNQEEQIERLVKEKESTELEKKESLLNKITRMWDNFEKQKFLCNNIIFTENVEMLSVEVRKLEDKHKAITDNTHTLNELIERDLADKLMKRIEEEESEIFVIKNKLVQQLMKQKQGKCAEKNSYASQKKDDDKEKMKKEERIEQERQKEELDMLERRLDDQKQLMEDIMNSKDAELMSRELQVLDKVYDDYVSTASHQRKMSPETGKRLSKLIDKQDSSVFLMKKKIANWMTDKIEEEEKETMEEEESKAGDQVQTDESKNKTGNQAEEENKLKEVEKANQEGEEEKREKKKAETGAKETGNLEEDTKQCQTSKEKMKTEITLANDTLNERKEETTTDNIIRLNELMVKTLRLQAAPKVEIDAFAGDPLEYSYFIQNFKDVVENLIDDPRQRFIRLLNYTSGEAKELIRHCVHEENHVCYDKALTLLKKEYGDSFKVQCALLEKLNNWPQVKNNDAKGLKELHRFLLQIITYEKKGMISLDSPLTIRNLQLSLPNNIQDKWTSRVGKIRKIKKTEAVFADFVEFVEEETLTLNDPVYSRGGYKERKENLKAFSTGFKEKEACPLCQGNHDMDDCQQFKAKDPREKKDFLFKTKLCFTCFKKDHRAKDCKNKRKCKVCEKDHPTSLHEVVFKVAALRNKSGDEGMCIVLVRMHHSSYPEKEIEVYAMLDECSNGTFIHEEIAEMLSDDVKRPAVVSVSSVNADTTMETIAIQGLVIRGSERFGEKYPTPEIALPTTFSKPKLPMDEDDIPNAVEVGKWDYLKEVAETLSEVKKMPLGLLIGTNCKKALEPMQVIPSSENGPYAKRTRVGWCVIGSEEEGRRDKTNCNNIRIRTPLKDMSTSMPKSHVVLQTKITDDSIKNALQEMWKSDFIEKDSEKKALSKEDNYFLDLMQERIKFSDGHYELPLPLRTEASKEEKGVKILQRKKNQDPGSYKVSIRSPETRRDSNTEERSGECNRGGDEYVNLPDNREMALQQLKYTKKKLIKDENYRKGYTEFMTRLIKMGYARKVPKSKIKERAWYAPHHGVIHPVKKKIRPVFNCSSEKDGISLNKRLIQGPDPANSLIGVLLRFRKGKIAFTADIETMYYQVRIPEEHFKFLRFFWWEDEELSGEPDEFEMCVHPFGAISSKGCVIFALHRTAFDNQEKYGKEALETLLQNFYIDDLLKSLDQEDEVIKLISNVNGMCEAGGFNLTKYICANTNVMNSIPPEKRASVLETQDIDNESSSESALGVQWRVNEDVLGFRVDFNHDDGTRRGCLSTIHRIKDPLGLAAPFLLKGRKLLQKLAVEGVSWDEKLSETDKREWKKWCCDLKLLNQLKIPRCYKAKKMTNVVDATLHCFSDASFTGYGVACYLRCVDTEGNVQVSLVMGKARVSPMKPTTVPRLELTAAAVAAKIAALVVEELKWENLETFYWVDNKIVLGYIYNKTRRYKVFVANRVNVITEYTGGINWNYVETKDNPADFASRGISPKEVNKVETWLQGPSFLQQREEKWRVLVPEIEEVEEDVEVKIEKVVHAAKVKVKSVLEKFEERISSWHRMKRVLAWVLRIVKLWHKKEVVDMNEELAVTEIQEAETMITKWVQKRSFHDEMKIVRTGRDQKTKKKQGKLWKLDPFIDEKGVLRVGGRLCNAEEPEDFKFPIIIPKQTVYTKRVVEWHHKKIEHRGKHTTIGEMREAGYWVVNSSKEVGAVVFRCVRCKWLRGKLEGQKMANLPRNRISIEPPFTYCGVDLFGPIKIREGRKELKRYGVLFTCLSMRAVHVEIAATLETDSFIMALGRFTARRGQVREIRCDNGSNFEGAENELKKAVEEMDHEKVSAYLTEQGGDWVRWDKNTPYASHMGGAWERQIRTIKGVLMALMKSSPRLLDEETLRTFLTEAEGIVNSRPLTVENLLDPESKPLCPNQILTMKSKLVLPPPGEFQEADWYCRKRWRIAQHLANNFWTRWRKEYLQLMQNRQKWAESKRNFRVGDVVLLKEEGVVRGQWPMGRVVEVYPSEDGLVRSISVKTGKSTYKRPIHKVVLLMATEQEDEQEK